MESYLIIGKTTSLNAIGVAMLVIGVAAVLSLPRRLMVVPFIFMACFMTIGQQLVIASQSFSIMRLMIAAAWIRIVLRKEARLQSITPLDKALTIWVAVGTVVYALRLNSSYALLSRLGIAYDTIGLYFIFRFSIREYKDLHLAIKALAIAMPLLMFLMSVEKLSGVNPFAIFGGVPEHSMVRGGRLRAQGPFRHPILAGTFAATSLPLFASLWHSENRKGRLLAVIGMLSSTVIVLLTASSGPVMAYFAAILSIFLWGLRKNIRALWYLFLMWLLVLAVYMKAPIWFLIARVSDVFGGGGYHRSMVIDQAIKHFGEWWLAGTYYTAHWTPYALTINPDMADITNQFIAEGVDGGVLTLSTFILMVVIAFQTLVAAVRKDILNPIQERVTWGLWGSLLSHVVTFFSVVYFDQTKMFWLLLLSCISLVGTKVFSVGKPLVKVYVPSSSVE